MTKTLLNDFKIYENIENEKEEIKDIDNLSPTVVLPLICSKKLNSKNISSIRRIEPEKGFFGIRK